MYYTFVIKSIDNKVVYTGANSYVRVSDAQKAGGVLLRSSPYMTGTEHVEVVPAQIADNEGYSDSLTNNPTISPNLNQFKS